MKNEIRAAIDVVLAVSEAIRELGECPSGELYAHLCGRLTLEQYQQVLGILKRAGLVTETHHLLRWIGPQIAK